MISARELNPHQYVVSEEVEANLRTLLERLNVVRAAYGVPMIVTSGLRSQADQARINPKAPKSKHITGEAADVSDPDGVLAAWIQAHMALMESVGFWFEDFGHTHGWVHFQIVPPASGRRVFIP